MFWISQFELVPVRLQSHVSNIVAFKLKLHIMHTIQSHVSRILVHGWDGIYPTELSNHPAHKASEVLAYYIPSTFRPLANQLPHSNDGNSYRTLRFSNQADCRKDTISERTPWSQYTSRSLDPSHRQQFSPMSIHSHRSFFVGIFLQKDAKPPRHSECINSNSQGCSPCWRQTQTR